MWFILSAVVSAVCSILLTKLVAIAGDDFANMLRGPYDLPLDSESVSQSARPASEPQMTLICLFVTGLFFSSFVQNSWLLASFATGVIGPVAVLLFIGALCLGYRGFQWAEYGIARFYRNSLHSFNFIDRAYAAAKRRVL